MTANKLKLIAMAVSLGLITLAMPAWAYSVVSMSIANPYATGVESGFTVNISQFQANSGNVGVIDIFNSSVADIASLQYSQNGTWTTLPLYTQGSGLQAKVTTLAASMSFRVLFNTTKPNLVGFSLKNGSTGQILSSISYPITISLGSRVLGASTINFTRNLQYGSKGSDVTALQNLLTSLGVYKGPVTGFYGTLTRAAVRLYQKNKNLKVTGALDQSTRQSLSL